MNRFERTPMRLFAVMLASCGLATVTPAQDLIIEASGSTGSVGRVSKVVEIDRADIGKVFNSGSPGPLLEASQRYYAGYFQYGWMKGVYTRGEWQPLPSMTWTLFEGRTACSWSQGFPGNVEVRRTIQSGNYNQTRINGICEFTCPAGTDNPFGIQPRPFTRVAYCSPTPPFDTITLVGTEFFVSTFDVNRWRAWRMDGDTQSGVGDLFRFVECYFDQDLRAEFDGVAGINSGDLFAFLTAWL